MTDDRDRAAAEAKQALDVLRDASAAQLMAVTKPMGQALHRRFHQPSTIACVHVARGEVCVSRLAGDDRLACIECAEWLWINAGYLSRGHRCDICGTPIEQVHPTFTTMGPALVIALLCLDCQPAIEGEASEKES